MHGTTFSHIPIVDNFLPLSLLSKHILYVEGRDVEFYRVLEINPDRVVNSPSGADFQCQG
jgi:hypothetical protein